MKYSYNDEADIITRLIDILRPSNRFCVDIAAGNGIHMSNTHHLYALGYGGLAVELDPEKFSSLAQTYAVMPQVGLIRAKITPENVAAVLRASAAPIDFSVLSLDIDGYDNAVLCGILDDFTPTIICTEINEKIPPPIDFCVKYSPEYAWKCDHFYGQSLQRLYTTCTTYGYGIVHLEYNNAFIVPTSLASPLGLPILDPATAYRRGYLDRADRLHRLPWNKNMECLQGMAPTQAVTWIDTFFAEYRGQYTCALGNR